MSNDTLNAEKGIAESSDVLISNGSSKKIWKFQLTDDLTTTERFVLLAAEFLATGIFVLLGCMSCAVGMSGGVVPHLQIALGFGFAILIAVQITGHISGGHANPVITLAGFLTGNLALVEVPYYLVGQFTGAFAGYALLMGATPYTYHTKSESGIGICTPELGAINEGQGVLVELMASTLLNLVICSFWDIRNANKHDSVPIKVGLVVAGLVITGGPYTGPNINPARSLAPAAWHSNWEHHWVFWIGPILGSFCASAIYTIFFSKSQSSK